MTAPLTRRGVLGLGAALGAYGTLAACSSGAPPVASGAPGASAGAAKTISTAAYDAAVRSGPVADAALVEACPWARRVKAAGVLRRGGTETAPIFSLKDPVSGRVTGFDAGIGDLLARYVLGRDEVTGLQALSLTSVDTRETMLHNGTVDVVVATYTITEKRAEKVAFCGPYYSSGTAVQVRVDTTDITSHKDLAGKKIVTETNSSALTAIKDHVPDAEVITFTENDACVAAVEDGRAVAYVLDETILLGNALKNPKVKVVGQPFTLDPYGIGVSKDDPATKEFVNTFLQRIFDDGSWLRLWQATVGVYSEASPTPPVIGSVAGS